MAEADVQIVTHVARAFRDRAAAVAAQKGYRNLQDFVREQLRQLIEGADAEDSR